MEYHRFVQRAKVYRLNDEGNWDDKGTGHVSLEYLERSEAVGLVVIDEEDNATLLVHRISADDIYRRAQETIISWRDPEIATDLALSFQETMCCSYIWDQICDVRRSIQFPTSVGGLDVGPRSTSDFEHLSTSQGNDGVNNEVLQLPTVELSTLPQILKILTDTSVSFLDREQVDQSFILKLVDIFTTCEDLDNVEGLHMLFKIAKALILLNDVQIFKIILSDKFIMDFIGMLEYEPDVTCRQNHRAFLKDQVIFKEAVPITDPLLLAKIHQTYKIGYIKDVILPNVLDNPTVSSLSSLILSNNVAVVSALLEHNTFIKDLFAELKSSSLTQQKKEELVQFLHEFCSLSKSLPLPLRSLLFSSFVQEGLFSVVTDLLGSGEESLRLKGADILIIVLNFDASLLWKFLVHQTGQTLFGLLITGMVTTGHAGIQSQVIEVMRMLLECETTERSPAVEKNQFLDVFYDKYMDQIMKSLTSAVSVKKAHDINKKVESPNHKLGPVSAEVLGSICELLCICIQHHNYRIKNYLTRNQVLEKVLQLTTRKEKYLAVAAIRVLRNCIGRKEDFYYRYIIKHDLFGPVVRAFLANGNRYNLLNSAVLELFNCLIKDNAKSLVMYSIEKYYDKLEKIDYVDTFTKLKNKYDQVLEGLITREQESGAVSSRDKSGVVRDRIDGFQESRKRKDDRALDKDEEEYFNEDSDDEEDTTSVQNIVSTVKPTQMITVNGTSLSGSIGLVDYEDDEDDIPTPALNNGNEQVEAGSVTIAVTDSVWLDREEDEMIQNVKRKKSAAISEGRENKPEVLKRRKTVAAMFSVNEDRLPSQDVATEEKAESSASNTSQQDVKPCKNGEEGNHSDADNVNKAVESLGSVPSSAGFVKTREAGS